MCRVRADKLKTEMEFTAGQIAAFLGGSIVGNENASVNTFSNIDSAKNGTLTFFYAKEYENYVYETDASIVLVPEDFEPARGETSESLRAEQTQTQRGERTRVCE